MLSNYSSSYMLLSSLRRLKTLWLQKRRQPRLSQEMCQRLWSPGLLSRPRQIQKLWHLPIFNSKINSSRNTTNYCYRV